MRSFGTTVVNPWNWSQFFSNPRKNNISKLTVQLSQLPELAGTVTSYCSYVK